jgi:hypothetical protein
VTRAYEMSFVAFLAVTWPMAHGMPWTVTIHRDFLNQWKSVLIQGPRQVRSSSVVSYRRLCCIKINEKQPQVQGLKLAKLCRISKIQDPTSAKSLKSYQIRGLGASKSRSIDPGPRPEMSKSTMIIPSQVSQASKISVDGSESCDHGFQDPHFLVTGGYVASSARTNVQVDKSSANS